MEPLAKTTAPAKVSVQHQKLLHFVSNAPWSDDLMLAKVQELVLPAIERHGPIVVDDMRGPLAVLYDTVRLGPKGLTQHVRGCQRWVTRYRASR